jgi:hypothetical protein
MKKVLLTIIVAAISLGGFAQVQLGLKGGLNISKTKVAYDTQDSKDGPFDSGDWHDEFNDSKAGINIGLVLNMGEDEGIASFQPELMFSQRGGTTYKSKIEDFTLVRGEESGKVKMNYFDIKLLTNMGGGGDNWKVYAQFGPSLNIWLSKGKYDTDGDLIKDSDEWNYEKDADANGEYDVRLDLGLVIGVGFKYKLGPGWLLLNPRYEFGIAPTTINDTGSNGYSLVNRTLSFNLGYLYQF